MENKPVRLLQISDIHLFADPKEILLGVPTQDSFQAVVNMIRQEEHPIDLILLSGDLAQDGSEKAYTRLAEMLKPLHIPIYYTPGNHDDIKTLTQVFPRDNISSHRHIILKNWHLILLNSHKEGAVEGYLDDAQFHFLKDCLDAYPEHQAIIVFHHQPLSVGVSWLDNLGLVNAEQFWDMVKHYPKVHSVLFGHIHHEFVGMRNDVQCYGLPSTCIQFKPKQTQFGLDHIPPGFRWVNLYPDGKLQTGITRISKYVGVFDENAKGY